MNNLEAVKILGKYLEELERKQGVIFYLLLSNSIANGIILAILVGSLLPSG